MEAGRISKLRAIDGGAAGRIAARIFSAVKKEDLQVLSQLGFLPRLNLKKRIVQPGKNTKSSVAPELGFWPFMQFSGCFLANDQRGRWSQPPNIRSLRAVGRSGPIERSPRPLPLCVRAS
jgi:hypothetical protein